MQHDFMQQALHFDIMKHETTPLPYIIHLHHDVMQHGIMQQKLHLDVLNTVSRGMKLHHYRT